MDSLQGNPSAHPWPQLNIALAEALFKMVGTQGEFASVLSRTSQEEIKVYQGMLNGRLALWMLYKHMSTSEDLIQVFAFLSLQKIRYHGDELMGNILDQWANVSMSHGSM